MRICAYMHLVNDSTVSVCVPPKPQTLLTHPPFPTQNL